MDKKIIEKYNMFTNVDTVLSENEPALKNVPALKSQVDFYHQEYTLLANLMQPLQLNGTGNAKAKKAAKAVLAKIGARVCGAMKSYAEDQNDLVLRTKANYSPSALKEMRDLEAQEKGQALYSLANGLAAELLPYGIKSEELDTYKAAVDKFKLLNPKVREVKVENKTLLKQVFDKVKLVNGLLRNKLDNGMMVMEFTEPGFYALYKNARRNYSDGVRHRQPEEATEEASPAPTNLVPKEASSPAETLNLTSALLEMGKKTGNGVVV